jgi:hypothetical protein
MGVDRRRGAVSLPSREEEGGEGRGEVSLSISGSFRLSDFAIGCVYGYGIAGNQFPMRR